MEILFVDGFLVESSLNTDEDDNYYRAHWFQYSYEGVLLGVFPFLGHGPRCLLPTYIDPDPEDKEASSWEAGWYLYALDGHGSIICVKPAHNTLETISTTHSTLHL